LSKTEHGTLLLLATCSGLHVRSYTEHRVRAPIFTCASACSVAPQRAPITLLRVAALPLSSCGPARGPARIRSTLHAHAGALHTSVAGPPAHLQQRPHLFGHPERPVPQRRLVRQLVSREPATLTSLLSGHMLRVHEHAHGSAVPPLGQTSLKGVRYCAGRRR